MGIIWGSILTYFGKRGGNKHGFSGWAIGRFYGRIFVDIPWELHMRFPSSPLSEWGYLPRFRKSPGCDPAIFKNDRIVSLMIPENE